MKRSILLLTLSFLIAFAPLAKADEGMWILPLIGKLNIGQMQEKGFKLTAEDIYSVNHSSLKDAVVIFGRGCTGELISDKGLVLTNHHCGYSSIQALSSVEHNYLEDGFWAATQADEIPAPGLTVTFLKRMEDVTALVSKDVDASMTENQRQQRIQTAIAELVKKATEGNHYKAQVTSFFAGNQYFMMVYEVFTDVRLVGTPPSSIGKFGHDTDNWMWPRHTGDFSMFRVYCSPDGKPADYSDKNIPYKPAHHLPISLKGNQQGDYAMTIGFPGRTDRYLTSWGIDERMNVVNRSRIEPRGVKQDIWLAAMQSDEKINIQYSSKYAQSSNYWKNSIGMNRGLLNLDVPAKKSAQEKLFAHWVSTDARRQQIYGDVLTQLEKNYKGRQPYLLASSFISECMIRGTEIFSFALNASDLDKALQENNTEAIKASITKLKAAADLFYKDYSAATDQKVMAALLEEYANKIDKEWHPALYQTIATKYKNSYTAYAKDVFKKSLFVDQERLNAFLEKPDYKKLHSDPALLAAIDIINLQVTLNQKMNDFNQQIDRNVRLYQAGLMEMQPEKTFYSDANFTMRLSYGSIGDYSPRDGVRYKHFTTLAGVMEKEDPNNWEFIVPAKLKELYNNKDYGRYADADGSLHVCFTTNNDITGGNSGSPVINANGELFGLAFDGNWEAMSGDIAFETQLQKCINVDIRYVLFIIDKYAGATRLIDEMTIKE
jgi:hypothetical protein